MSQRAALTEAEKVYLQEQKAKGSSLNKIAQALQCSPETTRKWWRRLQKGQPLGKRGRPKRGPCSSYPEAVRTKAIEVKKAHPHWGPISIKLDLQHDPQWAETSFPSNARLSQLFQQACPEAVQPRNHRRQLAKTDKVFAPHQRWQMDTKEGVRVGDEYVSILEIRDVYSGTMIAAVAFITTTPKRWRRLHLEEYQQVLRAAFARWGMPREIQTDNDGILVSSDQPPFPSLFTLWLVGLGILHVTSRPARPTDQGAIERNHRTLGDFAWKDHVFSELAELQQSLDSHQTRYNEEYPTHAAHCAGRPPLVAFPQARLTNRPFDPVREWEQFDLTQVDVYLGQLVWTRLVMPNGVVHVNKHHYPVGSSYKGQRVSVKFLPAPCSFCFQSADGTVLAQLPAPQFTKEEILGFLLADQVIPLYYQFFLPFVGV